MRKNTQKIAFYILIPMLVFTFVVTVRSENLYLNDASQNVIYQYFNYRNNKDIESIKKLLLNSEDIEEIIADNKYLKSIKLINIKEEYNESIKKAYIKNNNLSSDKSFKVYKVRYEITYDSNSKFASKSGVYDIWFFLTKKSSNSQWLIDIGAV